MKLDRGKIRNIFEALMSKDLRPTVRLESSGVRDIFSPI